MLERFLVKTLIPGSEKMVRLILACGALVLATSATRASSCETIRSQIDAKIRAAGVAHYTLTTIDAGAVANGKVVGTCDQGKKKIVYLQGKPPLGSSTDGSSSGRRPDAARSGKEAILTECKDGSVSVGGECKK